MKKIIILFFTLPLLGLSQIQNKTAKLSISSPYAEINGADKKYAATKDDIGFSVKRERKKLIIQKYDLKTMKELERFEYEDLPEYFKVIDLIKVNEKIYYLCSAINKKEDNFSVYAREIDTKTGKFLAVKKLFTTSGRIQASFPIDPYYSIYQYVSEDFNILVSAKESKLIFKCMYKSEEKKDKINIQKFGFFAFDSNLKELWHKDVKMPYTEKDIMIMSVISGEDGNIYSLIKNKANKTYELISVSSEGLTNKTLEIPSEIFFPKLFLKENNNGGILVCGYYANGVEFDWLGTSSININGIYMFEFNKDGAPLKKKDIPFSLDFIKANASKSEKKQADKKEAKGTAGIYDVWMTKFNVNDDGSILIIGETQYIAREYVTAYGKSQLANVLKYGDVIVTTLSKDLEILSENKIIASGTGMYNYLPVLGATTITKHFHTNDSEYLFFDTSTELNVVKINNSKKGYNLYSAINYNNVQGGIKAYQFHYDRLFIGNNNLFYTEVYADQKNDILIKIDLAE